MKLKEVTFCESSPAGKNRTEHGVRLSGTGFTYLVAGGGGRMEEEKGKGEREWEEGDYSQLPADGFNARPLVTPWSNTNEEV